MLRGAIKKKIWYFFKFPRTSKPPLPPVNLDGQNFSVKEILDSAKHPPLLAENSEEKNWVFDEKNEY